MGGKVGFLRNPKTQRERREVSRARYFGVKVRHKRDRGLPTSYDDLPRGESQGWKSNKQRKAQYRTEDMDVVTRDGLIEALLPYIISGGVGGAVTSYSNLARQAYYRRRAKKAPKADRKKWTSKLKKTRANYSRSYFTGFAAGAGAYGALRGTAHAVHAYQKYTDPDARYERNLRRAGVERVPHEKAEVWRRRSHPAAMKHLPAGNIHRDSYHRRVY